jgi:hypothetical protein
MRENTVGFNKVARERNKKERWAQLQQLAVGTSLLSRREGKADY